MRVLLSLLLVSSLAPNFVTEPLVIVKSAEDLFFGLNSLQRANLFSSMNLHRKDTQLALLSLLSTRRFPFHQEYCLQKLSDSMATLLMFIFFSRPQIHKIYLPTELVLRNKNLLGLVENVWESYRFEVLDVSGVNRYVTKSDWKTFPAPVLESPELCGRADIPIIACRLGLESSWILCKNNLSMQELTKKWCDELILIELFIQNSGLRSSLVTAHEEIKKTRILSYNNYFDGAFLQFSSGFSLPTTFKKLLNGVKAKTRHLPLSHQAL